MGIYEKILKEYIKNNKNEEEHLKIVCKQFIDKSDIELIDRNNFIGHFTASAFVISQKTNRIIMIHHNFLKKYLQPGGHIEVTDSNPLEASKRELFEETGIEIKKLIYYKADLLNDLIPLNISAHQIPENKIKGEKKHYHYDLQYLFFCQEELDVNINLIEVSNFEWIELKTFKEMSNYRKIAQKIENTKKASPERFLCNMLSSLDVKDISCIAVQHITKSSVPFIKTLDKIFKGKLTVFAKPNSIDENVWNYLGSIGIDLKIASRNENDEINYYGIDEKVILLDIGGYFAGVSQKKICRY